MSPEAVILEAVANGASFSVSHGEFRLEIGDWAFSRYSMEELADDIIRWLMVRAIQVSATPVMVLEKKA